MRPTPNPRPDVLSIATLSKVHGVKGELKLRCRLEHVALLRELAESGQLVTLRIPDSGDEYEVTLSNVRGHDSAAIVSIDGVEDRDGANAFKGALVMVPRDLLDELETDEYFLADLVGCVVHDHESGLQVGHTVRAELLPANVVVTIQLNEGKSILAPLADDAMPFVDVEARRIDVNFEFLGVSISS